MSTRFRRQGTGVVKDHNELTNKGTRTHAEIDSYLAELDAVRGLFPSIGARLDEIEAKNEEQDNELDDARGEYPDIASRLSEGEAKDTAQDLEITSHGERLDQLESETADLASDLSDVTTRVGQAELSLDDHEAALLAQDARITDAEGRITEIEDHIATTPSTSQEVIDARGGFADLDSRLDDMQEQIDAGGGGTGGGISGSVSGMPVGSVSYYTANAVPDGWLMADGSEVSRSTYSDLFAVIGTTFGAGDGTTTFKLPDLRGEFIRGIDAGRGVDVGRTFGSNQAATEVYNNNNTASVFDNKLGVRNGDGESTYSTTVVKMGSFTVSTSNREFQKVRPRNVALLACIKWRKDKVTVDFGGLDEEIVEARTGSDGTVYGSLKERLDAIPEPLVFNMPTLLDLPAAGIEGALYVVAADSTNAGKPMLYVYTGGTYKKAGGSGSSSGGGGGGGGIGVTQVNKMDITAPLEVDMVIPPDDTFSHIPIEVLKFLPGSNNVVKALYSFVSADESRFESHPSYVVFDGRMFLQTEFIQAMTDQGALGTGRLWSTSITPADFNTIESLEVL